MSIPTLYIKGSKKAANERLAAGEEVLGLEINLYGAACQRLKAMPDGTVIKFYTKIVQGNPYATSYGNWRPSVNKIK